MRYFIPQSGAGTSRSAGTYRSAPRIRCATRSGDFDLRVAEVDDAEHDGLAGKVGENAEVELRLRGLDRNLRGRAVGELREERIAGRLVPVHDSRIAEAEVHDRRHRQPAERAVDRLDRDALRRVRVVAQPRLVELDHVGAGGLQVVRLRVHRGGEVHHHLVVVGVELVLGLLRHGERPGQRDLRLALGVASQERHVADLDRLAAPDLADDARHLDGASRAVGDGAGVSLSMPSSAVAKRLE